MPAPKLAIIPSSLDAGASPADIATALAVRDAIAAAAVTAGFERAALTIPDFRTLVLRYMPRVPAGLEGKAQETALARLFRADYPADAYLLVGLSRDTAGAPTLEAVVITAPATGDGLVARVAKKYDTLTAADPIPADASAAMATQFITQQLPVVFTAANTAVNGGTTSPPAPTPPTPPPGPGTCPVCPPPRPVPVPAEVEKPRPAWHIPVAVGGGVVGGLLLGLLIASAMKKD